MQLEPKVIIAPEDVAVFRAQLKAESLPYEDLTDGEHVLIGYYDKEQLVGTGAIETYGNYGLLRSVSISKAHQGNQLGSKVTYHLIEKARLQKLKGLYLLTETARDFFLKIGFEIVDRSAVAPEVQASSEFAHVCPVSAVCMYLEFPENCRC